MTEPFGSVNFTALILAVNGPAAIGQALVFDSTQGTWLIATLANRTALGKRAEAIATSPYGGSAIGKISYQTSGLLPAELAFPLGGAVGAASWVRVKSDGYLERCTPGVGDDLVGKCQTDGRLILTMNTWDSTNISPGSGASPGGSDGDVQTRVNATTFGGLSPGAANNIIASNGSAWAVVAGVTVPAGANGDVITNDGAGGLFNTPTLGTTHGGTGLTAAGTSGNVLTSNGTNWVSSAPAAAGAPVGAQYITVALDATLTNERRLQGTGTITLTDGGAGADMTVAVTTGSLTNTHINASAAIAYSKLNLAGSIVNADVSASAAIASTKIALTSTRIGFGNGSNQMTDDADLTWDATNNRLVVGNAIRVGTNVSNTDGIGLPNNTALYFRNAGNSLNVTAFQFDASNIIRIGEANSNNIVFSYESTAGFFNTDSGVYDFLVNEDTDITYRLPRHGQSTPYASDGCGTTALGSFSAPGNTNVASGVYSRHIVELTGTLSGGSGNYTITFPTPASEDASYRIVVINNTNYSSIVITLASGATVTMSTTNIYDLIFRPGGVYRVV